MELEILAPSGDKESLIAALNAGADAIYLGMSSFNARAKAENFTKDNILETVRLIHLYGAKVYVTVNTIVKDEEYKDLLDLLKYCVKAHVDAYIVQDLGVARIMKEAFPSINLHASTQMGINNLNGALLAQEFGFTRIVLARETKLEDIKLIHAHTDLEIEYFIQGALCVSYSGNCYMSSFLHEMSGNRGKCLQLCRLEYSSSRDVNGYLLSARDLCLIKDMKELIDAGVCSFKIEGRLRHPGYVAECVKAYKNALKNIDNKKFDFTKEINELKEAFVRDDFLYGAYLKDGTPDNVITSINQNHTGVRIGKVISSKAFKDIYEISISSSREIHKGDGLKFFVNDKQVGSLGVGNVNKEKDNIYKVYSKNRVPNGAQCALILNAEREQELLSLKRKMGINLFVEAKVNNPLVIELEYKGVRVKEESKFILQEASSRPLTKEDLLTSISKVGEEPFFIKKSTIEVGNVFIPKSSINETRRNAIEKLKDAIIFSNEENIYSFVDEEYISSLQEENVEFEYNKKILLIEHRNDIKNLENKDDYLIILSTPIFEYKYIKDRLNELFLDFKEVGINIPLILSSLEQEIIDDLLKDYPSLVLYGNNVSILNYSLNHKRVIVSQNLNSFSSHSLKTLKDMGVLNVVASLECNKKYLDNNPSIYSYMIGYNTLMNFAHCPFKTVNKNTCKNCSYSSDLKYNSYSIRRTKGKVCSFELINDKCINTYNVLSNNAVIDLRQMKKSKIDEIILGLNNKESINLDNSYLGLLNRNVK